MIFKKDTRPFVINETYEVKGIDYKFIKVTRKGFNFVDMNGKKLFSRHLYCPMLSKIKEIPDDLKIVEVELSDYQLSFFVARVPLPAYYEGLTKDLLGFVDGYDLQAKRKKDLIASLTQLLEKKQKEMRELEERLKILSHPILCLSLD